MLLTSNSLFWRKQTSSIWFGDKEMQTFREKTYTRNYELPADIFFQPMKRLRRRHFSLNFARKQPENLLPITNIAILATERTQLPHGKKNFPRSSHSRPQSLRSFWPAAGIESSGSNHFEITKEITGRKDVQNGGRSILNGSAVPLASSSDTRILIVGVTFIQTPSISWAQALSNITNILNLLRSFLF